VISTGQWNLFGLTIRSELPLPFEQAQEPTASPPQVEVRFAPLAPQSRPTASGADVIQLEIADVGRFRISGGREIIIDPVAGASERNLRVYLLGSAFGVLLHQRGLLPLHGNSILIGSHAVAFLGRSGAGKSTLATWFLDRDYRVLADDLSAIDLSDERRPLVMPGVPRLRLWKDALERSGRSSGDFDRSFDGEDKFDVPAPSGAAPAPLAACYILDEAPDGGPTRIERLQGMEAVAELFAHTYRGRFVRQLGSNRRHMQHCIAAAGAVPVYRVARQMGLGNLDRLCEQLEQHARASCAAPAL
jgi:hypothetical protein